MSGVSEPTVMVVDDTPDVRELLSLQLRKLGYEVIEAVNGLNAVDLARQRFPSLILMDINMPVLDGIQATRRIRSSAETTHIPVIAVSAFGSDCRERAIEAGCNDFVAKPVAMSELSDLVRRYVSK